MAAPEKALLVSVAEMQTNQTGLVVRVNAGPGKVNQLHAMGIRPGVVVAKKSSQPLRGPVIIRVGSTELALGYGLARRITVRVGP